MGKKRKASGRLAEPKGPKELDPADARLGPISTYEDVADSEDEYFLNRDKIMLDDEPGSKRRRKEQQDLELSDEEILGYDNSESESESESGGKRSRSQDASKATGRHDDGAEDDDDEQEESRWWGSTKKEYYDADNIETEADALEEEAEAKRLQHKKLSKMREEDFVLDADEWLAGAPDAEENSETVTEVLKDVEVTDDMGPAERYKLLVTRYPEFEFLVEELQELQSSLPSLKAEALDKSDTSLESIRYWVLGCYVAALASYFAILTSPARDGDKVPKPLPPSELRDHDIMEALISCRNAWERVKHATSLASANDLSPPEMKIGVVDGVEMADEGPEKREKKRLAKKDKAAAAKEAEKLAKAKSVEDSVADLYNLPIAAGKSKKRDTAASAQQDDGNSDFGEEAALEGRAAADKAARKKSLKFYTSQIVQKANRRAGAGRDAGGDVDIPYRERLRDRQARLIAEAEKRGKKGSKHGADLGDESDEADTRTASAVRGDEDDYYDMMAHASKTKRDDKVARYAAYAEARKADRVVEKEEMGEDGKRKITYAIEKNKGLAPKRSKDVRNPRVKKRKQYDAKQKKLRSMRPVWQGGEPQGGYRGELSGINTAVIKSVKL